MDELVRWLDQQLDEDATRATAAADHDSGEWFMGDKWNVYRVEDETPNEDAETNELVVYGNVKAQSEHIAAHDPARVLREIEAKRGVLRQYEAVREQVRNPVSAENRRAARIAQGELEDVLRLLAVPYSDRPGYDEACRP